MFMQKENLFFSSSPRKELLFVEKVGVLMPLLIMICVVIILSSASMFEKVNRTFLEIKWSVCQPDGAPVIILHFHLDTQTNACFRNFCICKWIEKKTFLFLSLLWRSIQGYYSKQFHKVFNWHCRGHVQVLMFGFD